ncbi:MAG TPA: flagellar hook-length control protein FliK, partial [Desulfobacteria bacterium]|nr:flagellar hook-length control protein FliK [Desulfobacteria bacterium]
LQENGAMKGDYAQKDNNAPKGDTALKANNDLKGNAVNQGGLIGPDIHGVKVKEPEGVLELGPMLEKLALNLKEHNAGEYKEIIRLIQNVTEKIEFVRSFNIQTEAGRENMMVFYSTVQFEDRAEPLRLVVKYRDSKEKSGSFSTCRLQIKLDTPGLGPVKCEVQVANKNLTLQFITNSDPAGRALDLFAGVLAERLSQMSYAVDYLPSLVETETENELIPDGGVGMQGFFQVDLTV